MANGFPQDYVISKNLHRRHLNKSQRAMVAAKIANMSPGTRTDLEPRRNSDEVSVDESARLLNVNRSTVFDAKKVLKEGTPEEIEAVEKGKAAVSTTAKRIRQGAPEEQPPHPTRFKLIALWVPFLHQQSAF